MVTILTLVAPSQTVSAQCKSDPSKGFICPDDLPQQPSWSDARKVCQEGCYLFHPDDEREFRYNRERVALIPDLRLAIDEFSAIGENSLKMVSEAVEDKNLLIGKYTTCLSSQESLSLRLDEAWTGWEKIGAVSVGTGAGFVLAVISAFGTILFFR